MPRNQVLKHFFLMDIEGLEKRPDYDIFDLDEFVMDQSLIR